MKLRTAKKLRKRKMILCCGKGRLFDLKCRAYIRTEQVEHFICDINKVVREVKDDRMLFKKLRRELQLENEEAEAAIQSNQDSQ